MSVAMACACRSCAYRRTCSDLARRRARSDSSRRSRTRRLDRAVAGAYADQRHGASQVGDRVTMTAPRSCAPSNRATRARSLRSACFCAGSRRATGFIAATCRVSPTSPTFPASSRFSCTAVSGTAMIARAARGAEDQRRLLARQDRPQPAARLDGARRLRSDGLASARRPRMRTQG